MMKGKEIQSCKKIYEMIKNILYWNLEAMGMYGLDIYGFNRINIKMTVGYMIE